MHDKADSSLRIEALITGYGKRQILHGVSIYVSPGEIVALIGHNGAGKSTLLRASFGLLPLWQGHLNIGGEIFRAPAPRQLLRAGVSYIPQGGRVFTHLSVRENLEIGGTIIQSKSHLNSEIERVLKLFPSLGPCLRQKAGTLSGGQKQILSLARSLLLSPRILLLDEPSLGLSPPLIANLFTYIRRISDDSMVAVLIVEQKVREVLKIADRVYALRSGVISYSGKSNTLDADLMRKVYL